MFKTPVFWYQKKPTVMAWMLYSLGILYAAVSFLIRSLTPKQRYRTPILSVGNLVMGGSGKTPTVIAIVKSLKQKGLKVAIVSRGFGGAMMGPIRVNLKHHDYKMVGDEPLLMSKTAPVYVAKKRTEGIELAIKEQSPDLIIIDDGHQTKGFHKDISLLVFDKQQGIGNGFVFPAGPLREPFKCGMARADYALIIDNGGGDFTLPKAIRASTAMTPHINEKIVAFCGLGFPQKFKLSLERAGYDIQEFIEFPDHHPYTRQEIEGILAKGISVITTEKDLLRVDADLRAKIQTLPMVLTFESDEFIDSVVDRLKL